MKVLAIETSCDETAICIAESNGNKEDLIKVKILGNSLISQVNEHAKYGGVYPTLAVREHKKNLCPVLFDVLQSAGMFEKEKNNSSITNVEKYLSREKELLFDFKKEITNIKPPQIDAIAVTNGPGLEPALWVGINFARSLSDYWDVPLFGINHMKGHIISALFSDGAISSPSFPSLSVLVSGGHSELVYSKDPHSYEIIGETRDDALGEAYDKVGRILGLPFPGGFEVACRAETARKKGLSPVSFTVPMLLSNDLNLSFSGLKTAVKRHVDGFDGKTLDEDHICTISRGFEEAAVSSVINKVKKALQKYDVSSIILGGGVSANTYLQNTLKETVLKCDPDGNKKTYIPQKDLSTDNAIMIALAHIWDGKRAPASAESMKAESTLSLDETLNT